MPRNVKTIDLTEKKRPVRIKLNDNDWVELFIEKATGDLEIRSDGKLSISPAYSNVIYLQVKE